MDAIAGRYEVVRKLGEGAFGEVYLCKDRDLGRRVALKLLRAACRDGEAGQRFRREGALAARVEHPGVVRVFDQGITEDGAPYIVSAFVPGASLRRVLDAGEGPTTPAEVSAWLRQLAEALAAVHDAGVLHRDLKPDNVFVEDGRLLLGDFGLARGPATETVLTRTGELVGTPIYLAPEVFLTGETSAAADLWALGAVGYELAYGTRWREGLRLEQLLALACEEPDLEPEDPRLGRFPALDPILRDLLQPDPERRPRAAQDVVAALGGEPPGAPRGPSGVAGAAPPGPAPRSRAGWLGGLLALGALGATAAWVSGGRAPGPRPAPSAAPQPERLAAVVAAERAAVDRSREALETRLPLAGPRPGQRAIDRAHELLPAFSEPAAPIRWRRYLRDVATLEAARGERPAPRGWLRAEADFTGRVVEKVRWIDDELEYVLVGRTLADPEALTETAAWSRRRDEYREAASESLAVPLGRPSDGYLRHLLELARLAPRPGIEELVEATLRRLPEAPPETVPALSEACERLLEINETGEAMPRAWRLGRIRELASQAPALLPRLDAAGRVALHRDLLWLATRWLRWELPEPSEEALQLFDDSVRELWEARAGDPLTAKRGVDRARNQLEREHVLGDAPGAAVQARHRRLVEVMRAWR